MAMTAAPSLDLGPRRIRRRSTHLVMAPTRPKAVSAMPTIIEPVTPSMNGRAASAASRAAPENHAPLLHDEAVAACPEGKAPGSPAPGAHAGPGWARGAAGIW